MHIEDSYGDCACSALLSLFSMMELLPLNHEQNRNEIPSSTVYAHIAFSIGSKEKVGSLTEKFRRDGFAIGKWPKNNR